MNVESTKPRVDWSKVKQEYLGNYSTSYASLAKSYGVSKTRVQQVGTKENWPKLRQELVEKTETQFIDSEVKRRTEANQRHIAAYKEVQSLAVSGLDNLATSRRFNSRELLNITRIYKIAVDGEREALGLNKLTVITNDEPGPIIYDIFGTLPSSK